MKLYVKGWSDFQHYKHRSPPWIKIHKSLLDNFEFQCLPIASKALAPMLWLLASESDDGSIDADLDKIAFRLRWNKTDLNLAINSLIEKGFIIDDSSVLACCKQDAMIEKSRVEKEKELEAEKEKKPRKSTSAFTPPLPPELLNAWITVRKAKRAGPLTEIAWNAIVRESEIANITPDQAVTICCERSWQSFKASWITENKNKTRLQQIQENNDKALQEFLKAGDFYDGEVING